MRVGIIGGGIAGLVAAYELSRAGAAVALLDRAARLDGLTGSFRVGDGQEVEKVLIRTLAPKGVDRLNG